MIVSKKVIWLNENLSLYFNTNYFLNGDVLNEIEKSKKEVNFLNIFIIS